MGRSIPNLLIEGSGLPIFSDVDCGKIHVGVASVDYFGQLNNPSNPSGVSLFVLCNGLDLCSGPLSNFVLFDIDKAEPKLTYYTYPARLLAIATDGEMAWDIRTGDFVVYITRPYNRWLPSRSIVQNLITQYCSKV